MKLLMATCADESQTPHARHTLPLLEMYARRWDANFIVLDDASYKGRGMWNYRTLAFYDLLEMYDRVFYLDSDIVINKNCPNIFDRVPPDTVGLVLEDKGSRLRKRRQRIARIKREFGGNNDWIEGYMNAGLYVVSREHREIFAKIDGRLWNGTGFDCLHYMYQIKRFGFKYIDLGYRWNHMSMFSESWNGSPSRFDSHIIHYAGRAPFPDRGERSVARLIEDDIKKIYTKEELDAYLAA